ncbi:MAG: class I SAM-dependent methyltransferase [Spirosomataceae bacterium]
MTEAIFQPQPVVYAALLEATQEIGFTMPSEVQTCSLLRTLAASKPGGQLLELGTGTGLSTAWLLDGMTPTTSLISIDNSGKWLQIAEQFLGKDSRLTLVESDGEAWVLNNLSQRFDLIFADTWHGKYLLLDEVLQMLTLGGLYIIDDMLPQPNWPEGHAEKAKKLVQYLESREDLWLVKQHWASGVIVAVKRGV